MVGFSLDSFVWSVRKDKLSNLIRKIKLLKIELCIFLFGRVNPYDSSQISKSVIKSVNTKISPFSHRI